EGNHTLCIGEEVCPTEPAVGACLGHFPIRSPGQFIAKIAIGHLNRVLMPDRKSDWGFQYREPYELLKRDPSAAAAAFQTAAREYALPGGATRNAETIEDPISYRGGPLRYTPACDDSAKPLRAVAAFAEHIAGQCAAHTAAASAESVDLVSRFAAILTNLY